MNFAVIDLDDGRDDPSIEAARSEMLAVCAPLHEKALPIAELMEFAVDAMEATPTGQVVGVRPQVDALRGIFGRYADAEGVPDGHLLQAAMALTKFKLGVPQSTQPPARSQTT